MATSRQPATDGHSGAQLHKGDQIVVVGSIVTDTWKDNDTDQNRYRQTVLADAIGLSL